MDLRGANKDLRIQPRLMQLVESLEPPVMQLWDVEGSVPVILNACACAMGARANRGPNFF